jgi:hypothetical protein
MLIPSRPSISAATATKIAENTARGSARDDFATLNGVVKNLSGAVATVYVGGSNAVTTGNGFPWNHTAEGAFTFTLEPGEELWVICASAQDLSVLVGGR